MKASLPYALPAILNGELMVAAMTAMNATPNTRSGPSTTPYELITRRKPLLKTHMFGQIGLCESRRADSPDTKAEWGIYMGATSNLAGHVRVYIPSRGHVYSRRSFKRYDTIPVEWNFKPRLAMKKEPSVWDQSTSELEKTTVPGPNVLVQGGEKASDVRATLTPSASEPLGFDDVLVRQEEKHEAPPQVVQQQSSAATQSITMTDASDSSSRLQSEPPMDRDRLVARKVATELRMLGPPLDPAVLNAPRASRSAQLVAEAHDEAHFYMTCMVGRVDCRSGDRDKLYAFRVSVKQALTDPDKKRRESAKAAIIEELTNIMRMKALHPVKVENITPRQWKTRVYPSHMFLKDKYLASGAFDRIKARLVAGGDFVNTADADIGETSSPTVNPITVMMMINIAAVEGHELSCHDIKGAFLIPHVSQKDEPMFIRLDKQMAHLICKVDKTLEKFKDAKGRIYMRLLKFLYGLPQASYQFNIHLDKALKKMGFTPLPGDRCAYTRGTGAGRVNICVHVDDILAAGKEPARAHFERELAAVFEISTQKNKKLSYLGITIERHALGITVDMEGYRQELMSRFGSDLEKIKEVCRVPALPTLFDPAPEGDAKCDRTHYLGMVMSLMYIARLTRADILLPTVYLATKSKCPTEKDYMDLCRIFAYLKNRGRVGILFKKDRSIKATIYVDSSHGMHPDGKGQAAVIATLGSGLIHARTAKIKMVTLSSTESETVSMSEGTTYARWLKAMLIGFGYAVDPMKMKSDSEPGMMATKKDGVFARNKHIIIRRNYTREGLEQKLIVLEHTPTAKMAADFLTKVKSRTGIDEDTARVGMIDMDK